MSEFPATDAPVKARRAAGLVGAAAAGGLPLAVLGGVAVQLLCPSARPGGQWHRALAGIDVAATLKARPAVDRLITRHAFTPDEHFNRMNGSIQLRYADADGSHLDVFMDEFRLCHVLSWRRLAAGQRTLEPLVRGDWGLWRTGRATLERLAGTAGGVAAKRAATLRRWAAMPFSRQAQPRGPVGERVRWYEHPEDV